MPGPKDNRDARSQESQEHPRRAFIQGPNASTRNTIHMDSQGHGYARIYNENAAEQVEHPDRAAHLVRACRVEMHMDISEGNFYVAVKKPRSRERTFI